ncbi:MAG: hypothetical protein WKG01_05940 [Kofleriaceae bacterium]
MPKSMAKGLVVRPGRQFNGVKVFSASMVADRDQLGDRVTRWMAERPNCKVTEFVVTQSSDARFHCITISVFYQEQTR